MKKHHHYLLWAFIFSGVGFMSYLFMNGQTDFNDLQAFFSGDAQVTYKETLKELEQRKNDLSEDIQNLQQKIENKRSEGETKIKEIQTLLEETKKNYEETKASITQLKQSLERWGTVLETKEAEANTN